MVLRPFVVGGMGVHGSCGSPDLYQMLDYSTVAGLGDAMLVSCASDSRRLSRDELIGGADARVKVHRRALQPNLAVDALELQLRTIAREIEACVERPD